MTNETDVIFETQSTEVSIIDNDSVVIGFEMETHQGEEGMTVEVCIILRNGALERSAAVEVFTADLTAEGNTDIKWN